MLSAVDGVAPAAETTHNITAARVLAKPFIQVLLHKCVVLQMRIRLTDSINFFHLTGRQLLVRVKAPAPCEQSLSTKYFVNTRDAPMKAMRRIEDCGVGVGDLS